jgi:hypothetical protein
MGAKQLHAFNGQCLPGGKHHAGGRVSHYPALGGEPHGYGRRPPVRRGQQFWAMLPR